MNKPGLEASAGFLDDYPVVGLLSFFGMFVFCGYGLIIGLRGPIPFPIGCGLLLIFSAAMMVRYFKLIRDDRGERSGPNI